MVFKSRELRFVEMKKSMPLGELPLLLFLYRNILLFVKMILALLKKNN